MSEFIRFIKNWITTILNFPSKSFPQIFHYSGVCLGGQQINTVGIHIRVDSILRDSSQPKNDCKTKNMSLKCEKFTLKNIYISGLVSRTRINIAIFENTEIPLFYVNNRNIRGENLYKGGLHLMEDSKIVSANKNDILF